MSEEDHPAPPKPYLTTGEVAAELATTENTVRAWIERGVTIAGHRVFLVGERIGTKYKIRPEAVRAFIEACNPGKAVAELDRERKAREAEERAVERRLHKRLYKPARNGRTK